MTLEAVQGVQTTTTTQVNKPENKNDEQNIQVFGETAKTQETSDGKTGLKFSFDEASDFAEAAVFGLGGKFLIDNHEAIGKGVKHFAEKLGYENKSDFVEAAVFGVGGKAIIDFFKGIFGGNKTEEA